MKKILFILLIFGYVGLSAQQIYFCKSYTQDGQPIDADMSFNIESWGGSLYILFDNEGSAIDDELVYMFIDKNVIGSFEPFDSKVLRIDKSRTWLAVDYKFTEVGEFLVYFMDSKQNRFTESRVIIKIQESLPKQRQVYASSYFNNVSLVFCERVIAEKPVNIKKSFSINQNDGELYVYIKNDKPLNTEKILLDVWRKKNRAFAYDEFFVSKKYRVNPDWKDAFFKFKFTEKGEYKFTLFNSNEITIGTIYIKVY